MKSNSLAFRLAVSATAVALVLLIAAGLVLNSLFHQALERNFDARLRAILDGLQGNIELKPNGSPQVLGALADARFTLPDSGWYWQVLPTASNVEGLVSASQLKTRLAPTEAMMEHRDADGIASFYMRDVEGKQLRAIEQRLKIFGSENEYSFLVAGNFDELRAEVSAFNRALYFSLGLLGAGLLAAILFQVLYGLRPLKVMQAKLNDIRSGKTEMLDATEFPSEIQPVADEMNLLIQSNIEVIDRARMQVGNLAHALKTPISVLTNEARDSNSPLARKVKEQVDVMRDQVNLYLDRARRAARAQSIGVATEVEPVLQGLARTLQRINRDRGIEITVDMKPPLKFRGERQDLEEMVGNLMDNACKWAKSRVVARARLQPQGDDGRLWMMIEIDDDGPGLKPEQWAIAMKRGQRLDESKPGSGLGLNIVSETAAMHGGKAELAHADIGGLRAILRLPAVP